MPQCKDTTVPMEFKDTVHFGCPRGEAGRPVPIYGIVFHAYPNNTIAQLETNMAAAVASSLYGNYSVHYTISNGYGLTQWVDPNDSSWSTGWTCPFDLLPIVSCEEYPGWPNHPTGFDISQTSIHIAVQTPMSDAAYDKLVRLVNILSETYGIPLDYEHVARWADISQSSSAPDVFLPDIINDAINYCERCCDDPTDLLDADSIGAFKVVDIYGCEGVTDPASIVCSAVTESDLPVDFLSDKLFVSRPGECIVSAPFDGGSLLDTLCDAMTPSGVRFDGGLMDIVAYTSDNCLVPVCLSPETISTELCKSIPNASSGAFNFTTDAVLTVGPDGCLVPKSLSGDGIFDSVCESIVDNGKAFDSLIDNLVVTNDANCLEAVVFSPASVKDMVCAAVAPAVEAFDPDTMQMLVKEGTECLKAVTFAGVYDQLCTELTSVTPSVFEDGQYLISFDYDGGCMVPVLLTASAIEELVCDVVIDDDNAYEPDAHRLIVRSADNCLEVVTLTGDGLIDLVCDGIADNGDVYSTDVHKLVVTSSGDDCLESVSLTGGGLVDIICDAIPDNGGTYSSGAHKIVVTTNGDDCLEAVDLTTGGVGELFCGSIVNDGNTYDSSVHSLLVTSSAECMEAVTFAPVPAMDQLCSELEDIPETVHEADTHSLLAFSSDGCIIPVSLNPGDIFEALCEEVPDNDEDFDPNGHKLLVQTGTECMEAVNFTGSVLHEIFCEEIVDNSIPIILNLDKFLVQTSDECIQTGVMSSETIKNAFCDSATDVGTAFDPSVHRLYSTGGLGGCLEAVVLTSDGINTIVCDGIVDDGLEYNFTEHKLLVTSNADCMEAVNFTGKTLKTILCNEIRDNGDTFDADVHKIIVSSPADCMEIVGLGGEDLVDLVCESIPDNGGTFFPAVWKLLAKSDDECMEFLSFTHEDIYDNFCAAIPRDIKSYDPSTHINLAWDIVDNKCVSLVGLGAGVTDCITTRYEAGNLVADLNPAILHPGFNTNGLICTAGGVSAPPVVQNVLHCGDDAEFTTIGINVPQGLGSAPVGGASTSTPFVLTNTSSYNWLVQVTYEMYWLSEVLGKAAPYTFFDYSTNGGANWQDGDIIYHDTVRNRNGEITDGTDTYLDHHWDSIHKTRQFCHELGPGETMTFVSRVRLGGSTEPTAPPSSFVQSGRGYHRINIQTVCTAP